MLRKAILALALLAGTAHAQNAVRQTGPVTAGNPVLWANDHVVADAAQRLANTGLGVNPYSVTDSNGPGLTLNSANTSGQYNSLTLGHDSNGNALFTVDSFGGAGNKSLNFRLNGTTYSFPAALSGIAGPNSSTVNHVPVFNNTAGSLLADTGFVARPVFTTLAALQAASTVSFDAAVRTGNLTSGDMSPALYAASGSACSLNSGNGDNGSQVKSADNKCWLLQVPGDVDPRWWGCKADALTECQATLQVALSWAGTNKAGGVVDCGGNSQNNTYRLGKNAQANIPLLSLTHPIRLQHCQFLIDTGTSTTDMFFIAPGVSDTDGWGFEDITIAPVGPAVWRHTFAFSDSGNNQLLIRRLGFRDIIVYPSINGTTDLRTGDDMYLAATAGGTGFLFSSNLGPNVTLFRCINMTNLGDSVTFNGFDVSSAVGGGATATSAQCGFNLSNVAGAGETAINDANITSPAMMKFTNMYGLHIRGGVSECPGTGALTSSTNSMLTLINAFYTQIDAMQFQGGACTTPPGAINVDTTSRNVEAHPMSGSAMAGSPYVIAAAAFPTTYIDTFGRHPGTPTFDATMVSNQSFTSGVSGIVKFDTDYLDDAASYGTGTGHFTPLTNGSYAASTTVCMTGTWSGAFQIFLQLSGSTTLNAPSMTPPAGAGTYCLAASAITPMNGIADYLSVAAVGTGTGLSVVGTNYSTFSAERTRP